jgi:hypothetical protein
MADRLVERMRGRLEAGYWPRLHCLLLVGLASAAAFLLSVALLALHVHSMALRYGLAAVGGYGAFLLLIRAWVQWKWSRLVPDSDLDLGDVSGDLPLPWPSRAANAASNMFGGGRSGGGGASGSWDSPRVSSITTSSGSSSSGGGKGGGFSLDLDGDDLVWLLVALAAALAGLVAIAYVIYVAPTLLAEAGVNAAVAGKVYHGMRKRDPHHWTTDVLRRTAFAAIAIIVSAVVAGYALQSVAPEARSIRGVWQHVVER